jgi:hypothetical protein
MSYREIRLLFGVETKGLLLITKVNLVKMGIGTVVPGYTLRVEDMNPQ